MKSLLDLNIEYKRFRDIPLDEVQKSLDEKQILPEELHVVVTCCLIEEAKEVLQIVLTKTGYQFDLEDFKNLMLGIQTGGNALFDLFIENKFNFNMLVQDHLGNTITSPLYEACKNTKSAELLEKMLDQNCWIDIKGQDGIMPYQYALGNEHINTHDVMLRLIPKYLILRRFKEDRRTGGK